ncbi:MAG: molybdate ABC transporter substrate-binding protein [Syntrophales bacterium]|jgi:molybdate transport system substrate-binding protein
MMKHSVIFFVLLFSLMCSGFVQAEERIHAAVAANYIQTFKEISAVFQEKTGIKIEANYTSSGNLYSQIVNGAPYDMFLSADTDRPARLYEKDMGGKPFIYAKGKVALWSACKNFCSAADWRQAIAEAKIQRIALSNPEVAPYGAAAMAALKEAHLWLPLYGKLVIAQNVAQAFQYATTEAVDVCFCSLSSALTDVGKKGCYYVIDEAPPVVQAACVLKEKDTPAVAKFVAFLLSPEADLIKKKYGYK